MSRSQKGWLKWLGGSGAVALVGLFVGWGIKGCSAAYSAGQTQAGLLTKTEAAQTYTPLAQFQDLKATAVRTENKVDQLLLKAMPVYGPQPQ